MRRLAPVLAAAALLAGCGDDEEEPKKSERPGTTTTQTQTQTAPKGHGGDPPTAPRTGGTSPEDQPGGAGDEEPARAPAVFTGRRGRIRPSVVRVPPYIAVRVELRSADGRTYAIGFDDRTLGVGPRKRTAAFTHDGLRPGEALRGGRLTGRGGGVRVEASAEPGP